MNILFVHQNCPGQYKHLAPAMAAIPGNRVVFISQKGRPTPKGCLKVEYEPHRKVTEKIHPYLAGTEAAVINGQGVARLCMALKNKGFTPDVMVGNPGWGETLFLKDVFPDAGLLSYAEFFYRGRGSDVGFDPEFATGEDAILRARARTAQHILAIEAADRAVSPTEWQKAQFPTAYQPKIDVIHDGIDCDVVKPDPSATFSLPDGRVLTRKDEVLSYVSRNLEPYRGFHTFMRALPAILDARPNAEVVVVGGEDVSYGGRPKEGGTWRQVMEAEIGPLPPRVHFMGRVPYPSFLSLLQVTSLHLYLTYPFVLSWSLMEALAAGAPVLGSATPPVEEVIRESENGWLADFFDAPALATRAADLLAARHDHDTVSKAARQTVLERYALADCLPRNIALIEDVAREFGTAN